MFVMGTQPVENVSALSGKGTNSLLRGLNVILSYHCSINAITPILLPQL